MTASAKPPCADECRAVLLTHYAEVGVEANVSWEPPTFAPAYEPLNMRCPHGVLWYAEPTTEQVADFVRDGVE